MGCCDSKPIKEKNGGIYRNPASQHEDEVNSGGQHENAGPLPPAKEDPHHVEQRNVSHSAVSTSVAVDDSARAASTAPVPQFTPGRVGSKSGGDVVIREAASAVAAAAGTSARCDNSSPAALATLSPSSLTSQQPQDESVPSMTVAREAVPEKLEHDAKASATDEGDNTRTTRKGSGGGKSSHSDTTASSRSMSGLLETKDASRTPHLDTEEGEARVSSPLVKLDSVNVKVGTSCMNLASGSPPAIMASMTAAAASLPQRRCLAPAELQRLPSDAHSLGHNKEDCAAGGDAGHAYNPFHHSNTDWRATMETGRGSPQYGGIMALAMEAAAATAGSVHSSPSSERLIRHNSTARGSHLQSPPRSGSARCSSSNGREYPTRPMPDSGNATRSLYEPFSPPTLYVGNAAATSSSSSSSSSSRQQKDETCNKLISKSDSDCQDHPTPMTFYYRLPDAWRGPGAANEYALHEDYYWESHPKHLATTAYVRNEDDYIEEEVSVCCEGSCEGSVGTHGEKSLTAAEHAWLANAAAAAVVVGVEEGGIDSESDEYSSYTISVTEDDGEDEEDGTSVYVDYAPVPSKGFPPSRPVTYLFNTLDDGCGGGLFYPYQRRSISC